MATVRLTLEITPDDEPISGRITGPRDEQREFCGWTALATTIDTALNAAGSSSPGAEQEGAE